jgi:phytoene/squalene synthetase
MVAERPIPMEEQAFAAARQFCQRRLGDVFFAACLLPREKRDGLCALAAFCALTHEAIEGGTGRSAGCCSGGDERVIMVINRLACAYANPANPPGNPVGTESEAVLYAFARTAHRFQIPQSAMNEFVEGCRLMRSTMRYATWKSLRRVLDLLGGGTATASVAILGAMHPAAVVKLRPVGVGMAMLQILRSISTADGRLFLPLEDLVRFKTSEKKITPELIRFEADRARTLIQEGMTGLVWLAGRRSRLAAAALVAPMISGPRPPNRFRLLARAWRMTTQSPATQTTTAPVA